MNHRERNFRAGLEHSSQMKGERAFSWGHEFGLAGEPVIQTPPVNCRKIYALLFAYYLFGYLSLRAQGQFFLSMVHTSAAHYHLTPGAVQLLNLYNYWSNWHCRTQNEYGGEKKRTTLKF